MAGTYVFPVRLFAPTSLQVRIMGAALTSPANVAGEAQFAEISGGGRWVADFGEAALWTPAKVKAWRALAAAADNGATPILVPLGDRRHQPLTNPLVTPDAFGLSIWDDGLTPWTADQVDAIVTADAALGETELTFAIIAPKALVGGEHFAINHPTWGWRLYIVTRVKSGGLGTGDTTVVDFRPPLREAIVAADSPATLLNFDSPRCLMRVDGDMSETLDMLRFGHATARFVEAAKPTAA
jgi:hypothetical protein